MTTVDGGNIGSNSSRRGAARLAPLKLRGPLLLPSPPLFNVALSGTGPRRAAAIYVIGQGAAWAFNIASRGGGGGLAAQRGQTPDAARL